MVTVIIPVYNSGNSLERAINSVLSIKEVTEIILVDDGSKDNSISICHALAAKNKIVHVLHQYDGVNRGASAARNQGLARATNAWIQFLDADDELLPGKISGNLQLARKNGSIDLVIGNYIVRSGKSEKNMTALPDPWLGLIRSTLGITSANLWRTEMVRKIGGWNESLSSSQEYDLMFRMLQAGARVIFDSSFQTVVNASSTSISRSKARTDQNARNRIQLRIDINNFLKKTGALTMERKLAIHGFIFKNLGYLADRNSVDFKLNPVLVSVYRISTLFSRAK